MHPYISQSAWSAAIRQLSLWQVNVWVPIAIPLTIIKAFWFSGSHCVYIYSPVIYSRYILTCYWHWKLLKKDISKSRADRSTCLNLYLSHLQSWTINLMQVDCFLQKWPDQEWLRKDIVRSRNWALRRMSVVITLFCIEVLVKDLLSSHAMQHQHKALLICHTISKWQMRILSSRSGGLGSHPQHFPNRGHLSERYLCRM